MAPGSKANFNVGGVMLPRPFKIRRFSHFGLNVADVAKCLPFYCDLLGFMVAEELELAGRFKSAAEAKQHPFTRGVFMRHGNDHHSAVLFPKFVLNALAGHPPMTPDFVLNQLAWQVGSIREVCDAIAWLREGNVDLLRVGRDQPGGNWHVYSFDPERRVNEMFYGLEQIGWDRRSKPLAVYSAQMNPPELPIIPEYQEVADAIGRGVDPGSGHRHDAMGAPRFDVDGVLMPRPFKIVRTGPVRLFTSDLDRSLRYYIDLLGLTLTEEIVYRGQRCAFLRVNTEHHALALYPLELRGMLGIESPSPLLSIGLQVATYDQLRAAMTFLDSKGVSIRHLPMELSPGIDYAAMALDPEGNAFQLYYYMEQVGWDGRPRPAASRVTAAPGEWPQTVPGREDSYSGEIFQGPWA